MNFQELSERLSPLADRGYEIQVGFIPSDSERIYYEDMTTQIAPPILMGYTAALSYHSKDGLIHINNFADHSVRVKEIGNEDSADKALLELVEWIEKTINENPKNFGSIDKDRQLRIDHEVSMNQLRDAYKSLYKSGFYIAFSGGGLVVEHLDPTLPYGVIRNGDTRLLDVLYPDERKAEPLPDGWIVDEWHEVTKVDDRH